MNISNRINNVCVLYRYYKLCLYCNYRVEKYAYITVKEAIASDVLYLCFDIKLFNHCIFKTILSRI